MSPILFFIIFFICKGVGKIFLQINSAAVAFIDILIAAWEGLSDTDFVENHSAKWKKDFYCSAAWKNTQYFRFCQKLKLVFWS